MNRLFKIQDDVRLRVSEIESAHGSWPCRKGCADCCRNLAAEPRVSHGEWLLIANAIDRLPAETAEAASRRIRETAGKQRPVVCPLLDSDSGTCLVYEARPIACRTYGFYVERANVLGCDRIEWISRQSPDVIWGNHAALETQMSHLGPTEELSFWLGSEPV